MAASNISGVSTPLVTAWVKSVIDPTQNEVSNLVTIALMTDAEKVSSMISYLSARATADQAQIDGLSAASSAQSTALSADKTACNAAVTALS